MTTTRKKPTDPLNKYKTIIYQGEVYISALDLTTVLLSIQHDSFRAKSVEVESE